MSSETEGEKGFTCREWLVIGGAFYVAWKCIQVSMLVAACQVWGWPTWCQW